MVVLIVFCLFIVILVICIIPVGFKCEVCGKKRGLLARLFSEERDFCDECIHQICRHVREKSYKHYDD